MKLFTIITLTILISSCASKKTKTNDSVGTIIPTEQETENNLSTIELDEIEKQLNQVTPNAHPVKLEGNSDYQTAGNLKSIHFPYNSNSLGDEEKALLQKAATFLSDYPNMQLQIEGHCDERGGIQFNLALGEKRAKEVKSYLVNLGVDSERLSTISYGKEMPFSFGSGEASWKKNRRASFRVIKL